MKIEDLVFTDLFLPKETLWEAINILKGTNDLRLCTLYCKSKDTRVNFLISNSKKESRRHKILVITCSVKNEPTFMVNNVNLHKPMFEKIKKLLDETLGPTIYLNSRNRIFFKSQRQISKSST